MDRALATLALALGLLVLLIGCSSAPTAAPVAAAPLPTYTPYPTSTPWPTYTPYPTATAMPVYTLPATPMSLANTPKPQPSDTAIVPTPLKTPAPTVLAASPSPTLPALRASFALDVTIPDDTHLEPGAPFTKTWRLANTGTAPWYDSCRLRYVSGERMGASESVPVPATDPGCETDVSVAMVAPATPGQYRGEWRLTCGDADISSSIFVQIVVPNAELVASTSPQPSQAGLRDRQTIGGWEIQPERVHKEKAVYWYNDSYVAMGNYAIVIALVKNNLPGSSAMSEGVSVELRDDKRRRYEISDPLTTERFAMLAASWQFSVGPVIFTTMDPGDETPMLFLWDVAEDVESLSLVVTDGKDVATWNLGRFADIPPYKKP